jgi:low temperature requirement protein LtrA
MELSGGPSPLDTGNEEERHASWLELFFDLVFVLAVTRVADTFDHDLSPAGALHFRPCLSAALVGLGAFSFYVSRFPREDNLVRLLMLAAMLAVTALSTGRRRVHRRHRRRFRPLVRRSSPRARSPLRSSSCSTSSRGQG